MSPGEHIGVSRFSVYPEQYQVPSRVIDLSSSRAQAEAARARGRAYGFAVFRDAETWAERVQEHPQDTGARRESVSTRTACSVSTGVGSRWSRG